MNNFKMEKFTDFEIFWEFQRRLIKVYESEELNCIAGLNQDFIINDENILSSYMDAIRVGQKLYRQEEKTNELVFDYNKIRSDLKLISDEILHFTGLTILYSRYLSNPLDRPIYLKDREPVYPNVPDLPDIRYFMYATSAIEKLYNYWDRVGDLIASFFPEKIDPKNVYFTKIDTFIPKELRTEENIKWLIDFENNEYKTLNETRIEIVHYENLNTNFSAKHLKSYNNRTQLEIHIKNRDRFPNLLKEHIGLTLIGFVKSIRFMEFLNDNVLNDMAIFNKKKLALQNLRDKKARSIEV